MSSEALAKGDDISNNQIKLTRGRAMAARQAHNLEVGGSNPSPATILRSEYRATDGLWPSIIKQIRI